MNQFVYVAYGNAARKEARLSIKSLRQHNEGNVTVISDKRLGIGKFHYMKLEPELDLLKCQRKPEVFGSGTPGRWAKVNLDQLGFEQICYLDADTRVYGNLQVGFDILNAEWDMVIVPSTQQDDGLLHHVSEAEREATFSELGTSDVLQLQGGVFWFRRNERTMALFDAWREEWLRWKGQDQGALLRALNRAPVRLWLLGRPFNGGTVVGHRFGMARS